MERSFSYVISLSLLFFLICNLLSSNCFLSNFFTEVSILLILDTLSIELKDFAVFYDEDNYEIEEKLGNSETKLIIDSGKIIEITKSKEGIIKRKILTDKWYDWVDYWSVDFNFESKPEIIKFLNKKNEVEEVWTGNYIFENEWQSFRSKSNGKLELISSEKEINQSKIKIAVKVVDIFGNDTMKIMDVKL